MGGRPIAKPAPLQAHWAATAAAADALEAEPGHRLRRTTDAAIEALERQTVPRPDRCPGRPGGVVTSATDSGAAPTPDVAEVVSAACARLRAEYVPPDVGAATADQLETAWQRGELDGCDGPALAARLTARLRAVADDRHFAVTYDEDAASQPAGLSPEYEARETERYYGAHLNHRFRKVERLEPNIGLLTLGVFAPVRLGRDTAVAAMQLLANTEALIVDLRHNGGGYGETVTLLSSYLFDAGGAPQLGLYPADGRYGAAAVPRLRSPGGAMASTNPCSC